MTGRHYTETRDLPRATIAALIRADIKRAVASGQLPAVRYTVRLRSYSGGWSVSVNAAGFEAAGVNVASIERVRFDAANEPGEPPILLSPEGCRIRDTLEDVIDDYAIAGPGGNRRFSHWVTLEWTENLPRLRAVVATEGDVGWLDALIVNAAVSTAAVYGRCGNSRRQAPNVYCTPG